MAQLSLGESKWRMIRRVLRKKRFTFGDARNQTRFDAEHLEWMLENGFVADLGDGWYALTEKAKAAADLGMYDWEPARK